MTEATRFGLSPQLDITQILAEARSRWLRPSEVCEILRNHQKFDLTHDPPYKPSGGSLFLFDRKALRYFRKDGHRWRKKKDGKTVREAHEKLKSGSVDVLHCYYAHGEDNENFQRRSYWLLDGQLEHIVLVHYREVSEGNTFATPHFQGIDSGAHFLFQGVQDSTGGHASFASRPTTIICSGHAPSLEMEVKGGGPASGSPSHTGFTSTIGNITTTSTVISTSVNRSGCSNSLSHLYSLGPMDGRGSSEKCAPLYVSEGRQTNIRDTHLSGLQKLSTDQFDSAQLVATTLTNDASLQIWHQFLNVNKNLNVTHQKFSFVQPNRIADTNRVRSDPYLGASALIKHSLDDKLVTSYDAQILTVAKDGESVPQVIPEETVGSDDAKNNILIYKGPDDHNSHLKFQGKISFEPCANLDHEIFLKSEGVEINIEKASSFPCEGNEDIKKLDSCGKWMNKEIVKDCEGSLMASDYGSYWNSIDAEKNDKELSSLSRHMQLETDMLAPSLSQEQLFSILDFSPSWAFSGSETKVLISGIFLGDTKPNNKKWCCMFGEVEVEVEVLTPTVLRCQVPAHAPGRVPLYITCSNRLACSEVQKFEFRENLFMSRCVLAHMNGDKDEAYFLLRFTKMLTLGVDFKMLTCIVDHCHCHDVKVLLLPLMSYDELEWQKLEGSSNVISSCGNPRDALVEKLFKGILYEWLICKAHEGGKGPNVLDSGGQGVIHMAAALGYQWAMRPIVAAGVNPSFRDARGKTALHWAAYFGREETVVELVRLGAAPGAVEDPTSKFPAGQTAADLASSRGHKGIAGYLAEADLTTHLSSINVKESVIDKVPAKFSAEKAIETVALRNLSSDGVDFGELSLRGSLAAVRNSAQAAARIQAAFRVHSFRHRQLMTASESSPAVPSEALVVSSQSRVKKIGHFNNSLHSAAVKIQQKYRGWKGRKEFLNIRNRIVKIQAHVRGHQVRKQYKKVVWSVSIVEKAILRWRRKGAGLRGFRALRTGEDDQSESGKTDEYDYLRLGRKQKEADVQKALARVQSMVHHPEARDQYMRLVASSNKSKLEVGDKMVFQDVNS